MHWNVLQSAKSNQSINAYNRDKKMKPQNAEQRMRNTYLPLQILVWQLNQTILSIMCVEPTIQKLVRSNGERIRSYNLKNTLW